MAQGAQLIVRSGLRDSARSWDTLPAPDAFDAAHRGWRKRLVAAAPTMLGAGQGRALTHGVAAKLINCYLKALFVCGMPANSEILPSAQRQRLDAIHPPVDRLLMTQLIAHGADGQAAFWRQYRDIGWSAFDSAQYETVIEAIRVLTGGELWRVEEHWAGFRSPAEAR